MSNFCFSGIMFNSHGTMTSTINHLNKDPQVFKPSNLPTRKNRTINNGYGKSFVKNCIQKPHKPIRTIIKMADIKKEKDTEIITVSPDFLNESLLDPKVEPLSDYSDENLLDPKTEPLSDSSYDDIELHNEQQFEDPEVIVVHGDETSDSDLYYIEYNEAHSKYEKSSKSNLHNLNSSGIVIQTDILNDLLEGRITKTTKKLLESTNISYLPMQSTQNEFRSSHSNHKSPFKVRPVKANKGLRHFSKRVCDKVKTKIVTTYKEVADELVTECVGDSESPTFLYDQKNIRRRVYDALNVLMALDIISKNKKDITWKGLPSGTIQNSVYLVQEKENRLNSVKRKLLALQEIIMQEVAIKRLVKRNRDTETKFGPPPDNACVTLPFMTINTNEDTAAEIRISEDQNECELSFNDKFSIYDCTEVMKSMGFTLGLDRGEVSDDDLKILKTLVPKAFEKHITMMATKNGEMFNNICKEFDEKSKFLETEQTLSRPNIINRKRNKR